MKIGIISDTHIGYSKQIPEWVINAFRDVEMIIHAGDIENPHVLTHLSEIAPIYAVRGNCDIDLPDLPNSRSIEIGIGKLTFAHKVSDARKALLHDSVVMVYGHSHLAIINKDDNILIINPGSPTLPRGGLPPSVAVLEVSDQKCEAKLMYP